MYCLNCSCRNDVIIKLAATVCCGNVVTCSKGFDWKPNLSTQAFLTNVLVPLMCDNNCKCSRVHPRNNSQTEQTACLIFNTRQIQYTQSNAHVLYWINIILTNACMPYSVKQKRSTRRYLNAHHRQCDVRPLPATCIQTNNINITTKRLNKSSPGPWGSQMAVLSVCRSPQRVVTLSVCPHAPSPTSRRHASLRCNPARTSHSCCGSTGRPWSGKLIYLWYYLVTNSTKSDGLLLLYISIWIMCTLSVE